MAGGIVLAGSALAAWWLRSSRLPAPGPQVDQLRRGQMLYALHCTACHGPDGRGDGPSAADMDRPPGDLTLPERKHGTGPDALRRVIRHGVPNTAMAANSALSESDIDCLVFHVELLSAAPRPYSQEVLASLRQAGVTPFQAPRSAPELSLRGQREGSLRLADLHGKIVLLNFWSTTCVHCLDELPALERIDRDFQDRGVAVVSVCFDEKDPAKVERLANRSAGKLPIYLDPAGHARLHFDLEVMPCVFVIDRSGRLAGVVRGAHAWTDADIQALMQAFPEVTPAR